MYIKKVDMSHFPVLCSYSCLVWPDLSVLIMCAYSSYNHHAKMLYRHSVSLVQWNLCNMDTMIANRKYPEFPGQLVYLRSYNSY